MTTGHPALLVALAVALAAGAARGQPAALGPFVECAAKVDDAERLACYDAAAAALSAEARAVAERRERARRALAEERAAAEAKARADRFGSEGLRIGGEERLDRLSAALAETFSDRGGRLLFLLDNGQMWRQTEGLALPPLRAGDRVEIRRGALGGYLLSVPRVKRTVAVVRMR